MSNKQKMRRLFIFNGVLLLAVFLLLEWLVRDYAAFQPVIKGGMSKLERIAEPQSYPDIVFVESGEKVLRNISHFKNKWLVVNFWASWCAPCLTELPSLQKLQDERGGERFEVIAINMDLEGNDFYAFGREKPAIGQMSIARFWEHKNTIEKSASLRGYPTTWIIDPYGRVVAELAGEADWASKDAYALIDSLVKKIK